MKLNKIFLITFFVCIPKVYCAQQPLNAQSIINAYYAGLNDGYLRGNINGAMVSYSTGFNDGYQSQNSNYRNALHWYNVFLQNRVKIAHEGYNAGFKHGTLNAQSMVQNALSVAYSMKAILSLVKNSDIKKCIWLLYLGLSKLLSSTTLLNLKPNLINKILGLNELVMFAAKLRLQRKISSLTLFEFMWVPYISAIHFKGKI